MSNRKLLTAVVAAASLAFGFAQTVHAKSPVPGKPGKQNIVEIAAAVNAQTGEFTYLLAAATCDYFDGAVVKLLTGSDKLTLFAPTDAAFEALQRKLGVTTPDPSITCSLPQATVFNILAYHVTDGRRFTNSVFNKRSTKMIEMLNGQYIVTNPNLSINDNAGKTIKPVLPLVNINASNGVIHVIDGVLEP
ncbi:MAG TPA: fasciclin domain-containing protein [Steroidobacteraceae bacterium]